MKTLLLVVLAMSITLSSNAATKRESVSPFAMQLHSMEGGVDGHQATINLCRDAGIKLVRDEIHWNRVEREKGVMKIDDDIMRNVENTVKAGIEPMIILDYGNGFYDGGNAPVSKEAVEGFARYCEFMARTFKGKIKYWEIWNEPNWEGFWKPKPDPKDYTNLLKAAYKACKQSNPDCTVIGCATSEIPFDFIEGVLKEGGTKYMDVLSVHPYRYPTAPESGKLVPDLHKLREMLDKYDGKKRPIWITEVGWPTHIGSKGVTPARQADMLVRAYIESISAGVQTIFWYWFGNDGPDATYNEDHFGIRFQDGSPKPAYTAYQAMTRNLEGAKYDHSLEIDDKVRAHVFKKGDVDVAVLWCTDGVRTLSLYIGDEVVTVADGLGAGATTLMPVNGVVTITLTETPCYLVSKTSFKGADILPVNPFQFMPAQAVLAAGEENTIGIRAANPGSADISGRIRLLSDKVSPTEHDFTLKPDQNALLVSKVKVPLTGDQLRIPAEVEVNGRVCAKIEMLIKITAPALVEIVPEYSEGKPRIRVDITNLMSSPIKGFATVRLDASIPDSARAYPVGPIKPGESAVVIADPNAVPSDKVYPAVAKLLIDGGPSVEQTRRISFLTCKRAKSPVVLDGKLDEWADAVAINLNRKDQILIGADSWKGQDDNSAVIYTMWDDKYFYIAAKVKDDVRSADVYGEKINNNDGIEFYFDTDLTGDRHEQKYSADDFQYGCFNSPKGPVVWNWQPHGGPSPAGELAFVYDESLGAGGYIIEVRIPLSEIGLKPVPGKTIGFTVALDDDDSPGHYNPFQQERHMIWAGNRETWLDPTQFAQITFVE